MKHDSYSNGALLDMYIAMPGTSNNISQYVAVITRKRKRPDAAPTVAELYSIWSLAATFRKQKDLLGDMKASISNTVFFLLADCLQVRLFVVHSYWVQVFSAEAPLSYMKSILEGKSHVKGSLEITESPWISILSLPNIERLLLLAFESVTLAQHKRMIVNGFVPGRVFKSRDLSPCQVLKPKVGNRRKGIIAKRRKVL